MKFEVGGLSWLLQTLQENGEGSGWKYDVTIMLPGPDTPGYRLNIKRVTWNGRVVGEMEFLGDTVQDSICDAVQAVVDDKTAGLFGDDEAMPKPSIDLEPGILAGGGAGLLAGWGKREKQS
jgi:hypothetical protein